MAGAAGAVAAYAAGTAAASYAVATGVGVIAAGVIGSIVTTGVGYLASSALGGGSNQSRNTPDQSSLPGSYDKGYRDINATNTTAPIPVVYGERIVSGPLIYFDVFSENRLGMITCVSVGPIESFETIYYNDFEENSNNEEGEQRYPGSIYETKLGELNQIAIQQLIDETTEWTANHRLRGIAYLYTRHQGGNGNYDGNIPKVSAKIKGRKIFDPRDGQVKYSTNPALIIRDYLTSTRYGYGYTETLIDDDSIIEAANYLESENIECHAVIDVAKPLEENLKLLLASCRGFLVYSLGLHKLKIDKPELSVFTFNDSNMLGDMQVTYFKAPNRINKAKVTWINSEQDYQADIISITNNALLAEDNNVSILNEIDLPFTTDRTTAFDIGVIEIQQSRSLKANVVFTALESAIVVDVGDVVTIDNQDYNDLPVEVRVVNMRMNDNHTIEIEAIGYDLDAYTVGSVPVTPAPALTNFDPLYVPTPTGVFYEETTYNIDGSIRVHWNASLNSNLLYQVRYRLRDTSTWLATLSTIDNKLDIIGLSSRFYEVEVWAVNSVGGTSNKVSLSVTLNAPLILPRVSGLQLIGKANGTTFSEDAAHFEWRDSSSSRAYQLGSEPFGGNTGRRDVYFAQYRVVIGYYSGNNFIELREELTQNPNYSYTKQKNLEDGGIRQTFTIRVTQVGSQGQESALLSEITVNNPTLS